MRTKIEVYDPDVERYLESIKEYPTLTRAEEIEVAKRIEAGDSAATREIVEANLKFVVNIAKGYRSSGVPFCDLIMEGNLGLYKAAEKYNYRKGVKFITYAVWWIRYMITEAIKKFNGENEEVLADDYTLDCVEDMDYDNGDNDKVNQEFANDVSEIQSKSMAVDELLKCLKEREVKILSMYFGLHGNEERNLTEISKEFNMSSENILSKTQKFKSQMS